ncbi:2-methylcitrate dehydratase [Paraburkholderia monticola]|uniref:2-methylcitrate dehydratase n=1 Tax=Paraburkholderia monticola TaxID=1399968 RepID=A0A149PHB7_9BURK|nr:MmgE/PrpD family protein [Paraburkholderia monticola]KXU84412.1 2-methylcitrate dehydratase [Paraburkholderia monticola]
MNQHNDIGTNPYTGGVAAFVAGLQYEAIPDEVRARIKLLILDSLGCALFGSGLEWSQILANTLARVDTTQACSVWGTPMKLSAPHAALVNGTMIQSFELDDVHRAGVLHVGAVTLPPILAIAQTRSAAARMSGREFLRACVAGYEVGPRVGMCMGPEHIAQGWHSGATVGVFSAAAGAAAALRLDTAQTVHALGIGGTQSAGLMAAQFGAMVKRMHAGRAAQSGLYGALLAQNGFTGIVDVFENPYGGFCSTFSRSTDRFDLTQLIDGLGERFETMNIALKFYSCVGSNHTTLDAIRAMQARHPFAAGDVESIVVHGSRVTVDHVGWRYVPQGLTSAQLNLPYCVATLLLEGDVFVDQFSEDRVADPQRMALAERVQVLEDPSITALGRNARHTVRVEVRLRDGTRLEETVQSQRGSEHAFASEAEIVGKMTKLAAHRIDGEKIARIVDWVMHAEEQPDTAELARLLAVQG